MTTYHSLAVASELHEAAICAYDGLRRAQVTRWRCRCVDNNGPLVKHLCSMKALDNSVLAMDYATRHACNSYLMSHHRTAPSSPPVSNVLHALPPKSTVRTAP